MIAQVIIALLLSARMAAAVTNDASATRPNFVMIVTDDQDQAMGSMQYMYGVKKHLTDQGTTYPNHYCTVSLCCPSRVNMWTGKAAHNTNVTDLVPPYGGYPKFIDREWHTKWLFTWLQQAGYKTYFTGKLMNSHDTTNYAAELDRMSLDGHDFMLEPGTYQYFNTTMQHNKNAPVRYEGVYATDLLANRSLDWIDVAAAQESPFFLAINPVNPHDNMDMKIKRFNDPVPAPRHADLFPDLMVPRTYNFNPYQRSGAHWVWDLEQLNTTEVRAMDMHYRRRIQALQSVDELVNRTIDKLEQHGLLDNTYVIYTSDNGFHLGQHRLRAGKRCPYEEDVNVPFIVRGPGVPRGKISEVVSSHTDLTPTIVKWAGASAAIEFDGSPIPTDEVTLAVMRRAEHASIEYWGHSIDGPKDFEITAYKALRLIGFGYSLYYAVWCNGEREIYNMLNDPGQMFNLYGTSLTYMLTPIARAEDRLNALTLVLKSCEGETCLNPWAALHPDGNVLTLLDALRPEFDDFYSSQPNVAFARCEPGYIVENEHPFSFFSYKNGSMVGRA